MSLMKLSLSASSLLGRALRSAGCGVLIALSTTLVGCVHQDEPKQETPSLPDGYMDSGIDVGMDAFQVASESRARISLFQWDGVPLQYLGNDKSTQGELTGDKHLLPRQILDKMDASTFGYLGGQAGSLLTMRVVALFAQLGDDGRWTVSDPVPALLFAQPRKADPTKTYLRIYYTNPRFRNITPGKDAYMALIGGFHTSSMVNRFIYALQEKREPNAEEEQDRHRVEFMLNAEWQQHRDDLPEPNGGGFLLEDYEDQDPVTGRFRERPGQSTGGFDGAPKIGQTQYSITPFVSGWKKVHISSDGRLTDSDTEDAYTTERDLRLRPQAAFINVAIKNEMQQHYLKLGYQGNTGFYITLDSEYLSGWGYYDISAEKLNDVVQRRTTTHPSETHLPSLSELWVPISYDNHGKPATVVGGKYHTQIALSEGTGVEQAFAPGKRYDMGFYMVPIPNVTGGTIDVRALGFEISTVEDRRTSHGWTGWDWYARTLYKMATIHTPLVRGRAYYIPLHVTDGMFPRVAPDAR